MLFYGILFNYLLIYKKGFIQRNALWNEAFLYNYLSSSILVIATPRSLNTVCATDKAFSTLGNPV